MKPAGLIALLLAVNNGWAFATFVILVALSLYLNRRGTRRDHRAKSIRGLQASQAVATRSMASARRNSGQRS